MKLKYSLLFLLIAFSSNCYSQINFDVRKQKLTPESIDTLNEKIFVYETPYAITYFKQNDVLNLITKLNSKNVLSYLNLNLLRDTLNSNTKIIRLYDSLNPIQLYNPIIYFTNKMSSIKQQTDSLTSELFNEFNCAGAYLILEGKFMVLSKEKKRIEMKGLIARKFGERYNTKYLNFWLPSKKKFYLIVVEVAI